MYTWNQEKADELIPGHMQSGLYHYITKGIAPGGFLMAVLENNLRNAVGQADQVNIRAIPEYIQFLYNYAPSGCWGSEEKVDKWLLASFSNKEIE